ncbi:MAG: metallophosphoesterase [Ignavibacteria bacterium]
MPDWLFDIIFIPFYIFQGAVLFIGIYLLIGKIIKLPFSLTYWILTKFELIRTKMKNFTAKKTVKRVDNSRRAFLTTSAAFVSGYAFIGSTIGVINSDDYELTYLDIKLDNLPRELKGTTISLISDIHSGPYMNEADMIRYVNATNELRSDLIMIPGDLTNSVKTEILPFAKAFKDLKADKGIYASLGNHDYFSDPEYIASVVLNETPIKLLRNESEFININGKDLCIMGIEDTRQSGSAVDNILLGYLDKTVRSAQKNILEKSLNYNAVPKIALFHKPYFVKNLEDHEIDLVLSGHTHGGQVVLAKFGNLNLSFAAAVSKYISGFYQSGKTKMYVSKGIGCVALPIRFNCKPEITKITLV